MSALLRFPDVMRQADQFGFFEDFIGDQTDSFLVDTITDSGSVTYDDAVGGRASLVPSDGSVGDNDEAYLATPNEVYKLAAGKPMLLRALIQFTEANTSAANIAAGFQNAVGANSILDNGAGLKVSGDTIGIYKVDGGTVWKCVSVSNGGTATVSTSTKTAGGSSFQDLQIEVIPYTSALAQVVFSVDGVRLIDATSAKEIVHTVAYASATELQAFLGVKNGSTTLETLVADYFGAWQKR
jgi:hypothetical protein